ncbi:histone-lysine N-methyltransferase SMYD3 [Bombina bombina]|uniref:histone-lysine N-methyltransferase SMYD3 n=1 Tax=Bombina bombina TaxID=8345 RepID=UPI00235B060B|nr:histone-lysine N-methyltransferase SMYD3 [Bombina bombina]
MSLLNHSCDPNCLIVFDGKCLLLQTIKEISKGEELTVSYIDVNRPSHIRQKQLQRQYCFICNCHLCLTKDKDEDMLAGDPQASKEAEGSIARLEELNFQEKWQESLDLSRSLIRSYSGRLPDKNIYQLELLDLAMDAAIALELWEEALHFGLRTLEPFSLYYPHSHPVRALQINRVGKIQLFLEMYPEAMKMLKQAFDIMKITHGKDHILMKDLIDLLRECEASMKTK